LLKVTLGRRANHTQILQSCVIVLLRTVPRHARTPSPIPRLRQHQPDHPAWQDGDGRRGLRTPSSFSELWVGGDRPTVFDHVFASIQSLSASGIEALCWKRARRVLWAAIDQHRLVPFSYYGIADSLDLREIPWRRGKGYDVEGLTQAITGTDVWARSVLHQVRERIGRTDQIRALGFCVSIAHAQYMARVFNEVGIPSIAIWSDTPAPERQQALDDLRVARVNVVFSVDLVNEGVDVPLFRLS